MTLGDFCGVTAPSPPISLLIIAQGGPRDMTRPHPLSQENQRLVVS